MYNSPKKTSFFNIDKPHPGDLLSSLVVFLVALPLCLGIAIASGAPPAAGLIAGIIGGIIVGFKAGSPLQVSGPAAGLAIIVWSNIEAYGLESLGVIVFFAGVAQIIAGSMGLGQFFRAVSPAVIKGMLAGIGVLIFSSQFHVMLDMSPVKSGISNIANIPVNLWTMLTSLNVQSILAMSVGFVVIASVLVWEKFAPNRIKIIPGALVGTMLATFVVVIFDLSVKTVNIPDNIFSSLNLINLGAFKKLNIEILGAALAMAIVASAETLLCASATDQMHKGERTKFNKELRAQGWGNLLAGFLGALPITGVIVRTTANIQSGAKTRWSAILHGLWLLIFVALLPSLLSYISTASLAALLVLTGYKLMNIKDFKSMWKTERSEGIVFLVTVIGIVATDLLTGVVLGFIASIFKIALIRTKLVIHKTEESDKKIIQLNGAASFLRLPQLADAIESVPLNEKLIIDARSLDYLDLACKNLINSRAALTQDTKIML